MKATATAIFIISLLLTSTACSITDHEARAARIGSQFDKLRNGAASCINDSECEMVDFGCITPCPIAINSSYKQRLLNIGEDYFEERKKNSDVWACTTSAACPSQLPVPRCIESMCVGTIR